jgi:uncharacterized Zn finger protein
VARESAWIHGAKDDSVLENVRRLARRTIEERIADEG